MVKGIYSIVFISLLYVVGVQSQACKTCKADEKRTIITTYSNNTAGCIVGTFTCIPDPGCNATATITKYSDRSEMYRVGLTNQNTTLNLTCALKPGSTNSNVWLYEGVAVQMECLQQCNQGSGDGEFTFELDTTTTELTTVPTTSTETTTPCVESTTTSPPSTSQPVRGCRVQKKK